MAGKVAYVFPGQGAQKPGMGFDLYQQFDSARNLFHAADETLGFKLSRLCFEGPEEELTQTVNAQPAVLLMSVACLKAAQEHCALPPADFSAGHSLGEYSALAASGTLSFIETLRLVRERGRLMDAASKTIPGGMLALIGSDEATAQDICRASGTVISNINSPQQIVISGPQDRLAEAFRVAESRGIRRIVPLKVSGAFHSPLMQSAADGLKKSLDNLVFKDPHPPLVANASAQVLATAGKIKQELEIQLLKAVLWQQSVETMRAQGVTTFIEFGPGQVLSGLIKRIYPEARLFNVSDMSNIHQTYLW